MIFISWFSVCDFNITAIDSLLKFVTAEHGVGDKILMVHLKSTKHLILDDI